MTPAETARLLAACAAYDRRTVGEMDVLAWHKAIGHLPYDDALEAVARHYAESREWIMPADVNGGAKAIRTERARRKPAEVRALPSRYEDDQERDIRMRRGLAQCRDVLGPVMERLAAQRQAAITNTSTEELTA